MTEPSATWLIERAPTAEQCGRCRVSILPGQPRAVRVRVRDSQRITLATRCIYRCFDRNHMRAYEDAPRRAGGDA